MYPGRLGRVLGEVLQYALVVVLPGIACLRRRPPAEAGPGNGRFGPAPSELGLPPEFHRVRQLPCPADRLADPAHALRVAVHDADRAKLVQRTLGRHGGGVDALAGGFDVVTDVWGTYVGQEDHLKVLRRR